MSEENNLLLKNNCLNPGLKRLSNCIANMLFFLKFLKCVCADCSLMEYLEPIADIFKAFFLPQRRSE